MLYPLHLYSAVLRHLETIQIKLERKRRASDVFFFYISKHYISSQSRTYTKYDFIGIHFSQKFEILQALSGNSKVALGHRFSETCGIWAKRGCQPNLFA